MVANREYVSELMRKNNWSIGKMAEKSGVSKTTVSRWLSGKRGAGRRLISGLMKAFPSEPMEKLFFLG
jgi:transcriptional regulator with XRE-family HTH domain